MNSSGGFLDVEDIFKYIENAKINEIDESVRNDYQYFRRPNPTLDVFQRMTNRIIKFHGYSFSGQQKFDNTASSEKLDEILLKLGDLHGIKDQVGRIEGKIFKHDIVLESLSKNRIQKSSSLEFKMEKMISNTAMMLERIKKMEQHQDGSLKSLNVSPIALTREQPEIEIPNVPLFANEETNNKTMEKKPTRESRIPRPSDFPHENPPKQPKKKIGGLKLRDLHEEYKKERGSLSDPIKKRTIRIRGRGRPSSSGGRRKVTEEKKPPFSESQSARAIPTKTSSQRIHRQFHVDEVLGSEKEPVKTKKKPVKLELEKESGNMYEPEEVGKPLILVLKISGQNQSVLKREFVVKWNGQTVLPNRILRKKTESHDMDSFKIQVIVERKGENKFFLRFLDEPPMEASIEGCWTPDMTKTKMKVLVKKKFPNSLNEKWRRSVLCPPEHFAQPYEGRVRDMSQDQLDRLHREGERVARLGDPERMKCMRVWENNELIVMVSFYNEYDVMDLLPGAAVTMKPVNEEGNERIIKLTSNSKMKLRGNYIANLPTDLPGEFEVCIGETSTFVRIFPLRSAREKKRSSPKNNRFRSTPTSLRRKEKMDINKSAERQTTTTTSTIPKQPVQTNIKPVEGIRIHICGNVGVVKDFPKRLKENLDGVGVSCILLQEKVNRTKYHSYQMTWRRKMFDIHLRLSCDSTAPIVDDVRNEMKFLSKNSSTKSAIHVHFVPYMNFDEYTSRYNGKKIKDQDASFRSGVCLGTIYEEKNDFTFIHSDGNLKISDPKVREKSKRLSRFYDENMKSLCKMIKKIFLNLGNIQRIADASLD